jgi:hypothetical protein
MFGVWSFHGLYIVNVHFVLPQDFFLYTVLLEITMCKEWNITVLIVVCGLSSFIMLASDHTLLGKCHSVSLFTVLSSPSRPGTLLSGILHELSPKSTIDPFVGNSINLCFPVLLSLGRPCKCANGCLNSRIQPSKNVRGWRMNISVQLLMPSEILRDRR